MRSGSPQPLMDELQKSAHEGLSASRAGSKKPGNARLFLSVKRLLLRLGRCLYDWLCRHFRWCCRISLRWRRCA